MYWQPVQFGSEMPMNEDTDTRRPVHIDRLVERYAFTAVRTAALVLLAAVEDPVARRGSRSWWLAGRQFRGADRSPIYPTGIR